MKSILIVLLAVASQAMAADPVTVKVNNPLAPMMIEPFSGVLVGEGSVRAKGSFYIPDLTGDAQMYPNVTEINCSKDRGECVVATVTLAEDIHSLAGSIGYRVWTDLSHHKIVEWGDSVVRARNDTDRCTTMDYVVLPQLNTVRFEKQAKPTNDPHCVGGPFKTAQMAFVLWSGD